MIPQSTSVVLAEGSTFPPADDRAKAGQPVGSGIPADEAAAVTCDIANQDYRSALVTLGKRPPSGEVLARAEKGVVYDGAVGFLKWGSMWEGRHQVAVLDRTEPYFQDAISAINERFARHGAQDGVIVPDGDTPAGGEILVFREPVA